MAGIYIHIPFCRKACHYCNFHFSTTHSRLPRMLEAIEKEIQLRKNYLKEPIYTIYFGGGTPSICTIQQISSLLTKIKECFIVAKDAEITLEANPDDISVEKLIEWKKLGINRLSIGIQSFNEEELKWMNRAHTATQALECINWVKETGFDNFSIDLIYGTPTLTDEQWQNNVQTAIALQIPHLSCYALTVEPNTALNKMIAQQKALAPNADNQAIHFELLMQWMNNAGYEHYEISNFALPNFRSKHNSSYWQGTNYIGIGPSAHSFNGKSRQWNISNNSIYINTIDQETVPFETEELTPTQCLNEYIMTSIRTIEGLSLTNISEKWGEDKSSLIFKNSVKYTSNGLLVLKDNHLILSNKGKLLGDGIASDLFFI